MIAAREAASTASPVIDFSTMSKRRGEYSAREIASAHADYILIKACIEYAMQIRGAQVSYEIDPTDSDFAAFLDTQAQARAGRLLGTIMANDPMTMDGLRAKAALIPIVLEDWSGDLSDREQNFVNSIAADVIRFQRASTRKGEATVSIAEAS